MFRFLNASRIRYVIVGGLAAGYLGEPRATQDADLVTFLSSDDLERLIAFARRRRARVSAAAVRKGAATDAFFRFTIKGVQIDFMVGQTSFEFDVLSRRRHVRLFATKVPMASPEDVILMKLVSGRPQDWQDAKAILLRHARTLDTRYLEHWARALRVQRGRGPALQRLTRLRQMTYREAPSGKVVRT